MEVQADALCGVGGSLSTVGVVKGMISRAERVLGLCDAELRCMRMRVGKHQAFLFGHCLHAPPTSPTTLASQLQIERRPSTPWQALGGRIR